MERNTPIEVVEVEEFKKLVKEMYRGFPNYGYWNIDKINKTMMKHLENTKFFIKGKYKDKDGSIKNGYSLGVVALPYVNSLKAEESNDIIKSLTVGIFLLNITLVILTFALLIKDFLPLHTLGLFIAVAGLWNYYLILSMRNQISAYIDIKL